MAGEAEEEPLSFFAEPGERWRWASVWARTEPSEEPRFRCRDETVPLPISRRNNHLGGQTYWLIRRDCARFPGGTAAGREL